MKVLVTGGTGFAGRHLLALLAARGHECWFTTRSSRNLEAAPAGRGVLLSLPDEEASLSILRDVCPDAVVHLAGMAYVPEAERSPRLALRANVEGTLSLIRALEAADPGLRARLIFASTAQVYDIRDAKRYGTRGIGEDAPLWPPNVYAQTKLAAEVIAGAHALASGRNLILFRPFNHVGPAQRPDFAVASFARQVARIEREEAEPFLDAGNLDVSRDFCDVRDIVDAYRLAVEGSVPPGTYNLASEEATPLRAIVDLLQGLSRRPFEVRVRGDLLREGEALSVRGDASRIHVACGWSAKVPLETSVRDTLEDWRRRDDRG